MSHLNSTLEFIFCFTQQTVTCNGINNTEKGLVFVWPILGELKFTYLLVRRFHKYEKIPHDTYTYSVP